MPATSEAPDKPRNHFDEFVAFLKQQTWMAEGLRKELIVQFMAAQRDAYERGVASVGGKR